MARTPQHTTTRERIKEALRELPPRDPYKPIFRLFLRLIDEERRETILGLKEERRETKLGLTIVSDAGKEGRAAIANDLKAHKKEAIVHDEKVALNVTVEGDNHYIYADDADDDIDDVYVKSSLNRKARLRIRKYP